MTYGYDADVSLLLSKTADNNIFTIAQDLVVRLEASREGTGNVRLMSTLFTLSHA